MSSLADELAQLREQVTDLEQRLADMQLKIVDTKVEIATMQVEYEQIVWPVQEQLNKVKQQIEDIRGYSGESFKIAGVPDDYVPADEQYRRSFRPSASDHLRKIEGFKPRTSLPRDDVTLKKLYRDLALQYHPDLAPDNDTRERWSGYMKKINQAYANGDAATLASLEATLASEAPLAATQSEQEPDSAPMALAMVPHEDELEAVQSRLDALSVAMQSAEAEYFELQIRWEMDLQKEINKAKDDGRNLLNEIAVDLQQQISRAKKELASLGG